jgi:hypothetical protein
MDEFADSTAAALDVELALASPAGRPPPTLPPGEQLLASNLYSVSKLVAGRAARASSARQYLTSYARFCDALRDELGRPPVVGDVTADAVAAYSLALQRHGGRGGEPASPATRRVHPDDAGVALTQLGRDGEAADVRVPSHRVSPPETMSSVDYGNLIRATDRRTVVGRRDQALLRQNATAAGTRGAPDDGPPFATAIAPNREQALAKTLRACLARASGSHPGTSS